jgi:acetylornithine deacetylase
VATSPLAGDLIVTAVADEEAYSIGTEAVAQMRAADAAVVAEPTDMEVVVAHKGFVWPELATDGVAAHGSRYDLGVDAIARMGPVLVGLAALDEPCVPTAMCHLSSAGRRCTRRSSKAAKSCRHIPTAA